MDIISLEQTQVTQLKISTHHLYCANVDLSYIWGCPGLVSCPRNQWRAIVAIDYMGLLQ